VDRPTAGTLYSKSFLYLSMREYHIVDIYDAQVITAWNSLGAVNGARAGTFSFDTYPSMHSINILYKNKEASDSGLRLRWQSQAAGDYSAFTYAYSGIVQGGYTVLNGDTCTRSATTCRLDNVASSTIDGLYNYNYIKFTAAGACNNRWTQISTTASNSAATSYRSSDRCIFMPTNWLDGAAAGCTCAIGDQFKLIEWLSLDGALNSAAAASTTCPLMGSTSSSKLSAQVAISDGVISIPPSDVLILGLRPNMYIKVEEEIMLISSISATTSALTVTRTPASAVFHPLGSTVSVLSQFLINIDVPWPGTTFVGNVILFTSGTCVGRWSTITFFGSRCVTVGGLTVGGGNNWKDGGPACLASNSDSFLVITAKLAVLFIFPFALLTSIDAACR
jgi:hypothetical protein